MFDWTLEVHSPRDMQDTWRPRRLESIQRLSSQQCTLLMDTREPNLVHASGHVGRVTRLLLHICAFDGA